MANEGESWWQAVSPYLDEVLEIPEDERVAWLQVLSKRDPALAAQLKSLLSEHLLLREEGYLEECPIVPGGESQLAGRSIGAYTLVSPIGEGGMGSVWLAERSDGRFERRVAMKFVNIALAGRIGEERFKREGRILGGLKHPNIAELVDAGVTGTGQPYLVLEHVDGERIDTHCERRNLDVDARVRLFLDVLAAVAHAHANLIVHRDIKPSNVLVSTGGQVKLLDFGIAKLVEKKGGGDVTMLTRDAAAMTPLYAAPEQVTGGVVTTATDVYAMGVLLYILLAGRHPAGEGPHSPAELMRAIAETEPPRLSDVRMPGKLRHLVHGDLDTIVAKALRKNPQERYASVTALAEDLRRYLKNEPIRARPDTLLYRAGKFLRRNRLMVAIVMLASTALIVTAGIAVREATEARDRFNQVRKIARTFLFDFHGELERVPGTTKAKELLISTAREYLDNLARSAGNDRGLLLELAEAYERLAAAQGGSSAINLNQRNAALENRMRAVEIRLRLAGSNQAEDTKLVYMLSLVTDDLRNLGRLNEAMTMGRRAVEAGKTMLKGAHPEYLIDRSKAHLNLARVFQDLGRLEEAESELEVGERLMVASPNERVARQMIASKQDRGDLLQSLGRLAEAVSVLEEAERDGDRLLAGAQPGTALLALRTRQVTWAMLADVYDSPLAPSLHQPERALVYRDKLRKGWEHLLSLDPNNNSARTDLAVCDSETSLTLMKINPREAVGMARRGLDLFSQLERANPEDEHLVYRSARGATRLAQALLTAGHSAEARRTIEPSLRKHRELIAKRKDHPGYQTSLAWTLVVLARVEKSLHNQEQARTALGEAIRLAEPLADSLDLHFLMIAAEAYQAYGDSVSGEERCRALRRAQELWQGWKGTSSPWVEARRKHASQLAASCLGLAL